MTQKRVKNPSPQDENDHFSNNILMVLLLVLIFVTLIGTIAILNVLDDVKYQLNQQSFNNQVLHEASGGKVSLKIESIEDNQETSEESLQ